MDLNALLPATALPRFKAYRVAAPSFVWQNPAGGEEVSLDEHAYFLPLQDDPGSVHTSTIKEFAAERYGGHGIGTNGGGARCGLSGKLQIKGIGKNNVAGIGDDFFHTYGGASINEGIVEAIWGEIFHNVLPHGSVRVRGLLATDTRVPLVLPIPGTDPTTSRALIIRDAAIRPAHYLRSPYFKPVSPGADIAHDPVRTRASVELFPAAVQAIFRDDGQPTNDPAYLNDRLAAIFYRFGQQIAAARSKRLMHGSLIASNISLDGRWLDFGTASSVPTWGHIVSPRGPDFLAEQLMLHPTVVELLFSLRKYLPHNLGAHLRSTAAFWEDLCRGMSDELPRQFLKLTGIPVAEARNCNPALASAFYEALNKVILSGNERRFLIMSDNSEESLLPCSQTGDYHLLSILRCLAISDDATRAEAALASVLPRHELRTTLVRSFHAVRQAFIERYPSGERASKMDFCKLNSLRLTSFLTTWYRPRLYDRIGKAIRNDDNISSLISEILKLAEATLYDDHEGQVDLSAVFHSPAALDFASGLTVAGVTMPVQSGIDTIMTYLSLQKNELSDTLQ